MWAFLRLAYIPYLALVLAPPLTYGEVWACRRPAYSSPNPNPHPHPHLTLTLTLTLTLCNPNPNEECEPRAQERHARPDDRRGSLRGSDRGHRDRQVYIP